MRKMSGRGDTSPTQNSIMWNDDDDNDYDSPFLHFQTPEELSTLVPVVVYDWHRHSLGEKIAAQTTTTSYCHTILNSCTYQ
jgi:hypothetical protein